MLSSRETKKISMMLFAFIVLCCTEATELMDNSREIPPLVFPEDSSKYNIRPPKQLPVTLLSDITRPIVSSPEQPPLVFPVDSTKYRIIPNNSTIIKSLVDKSENVTRDVEMLVIPLHSVDNSVNPKLQTEYIQVSDDVKDREVVRDQQLDLQAHGIRGLVVIFGVFTIGLAVYLTVAMRRRYNKRNGSRQILVNEEDVI